MNVISTNSLKKILQLMKTKGIVAKSYDSDKLNGCYGSNTNTPNTYVLRDSDSRIRAVQGSFCGRKSDAGLPGMYSNGAIEIREVGNGGNTIEHIPINYPRIGFHWGNITGGSLCMNDNNEFIFYKLNGTDVAEVICVARYARYDTEGNDIAYVLKEVRNSITILDERLKKLGG